MSWPRDLDQLEANLQREVANLDPNMISRALGDIRNRAQLCLDNNALWFQGMGAHPVARWSPMLGEEHFATSWVWAGYI